MIAEDKAVMFTSEVQWAVRNYYKDCGFIKSEERLVELKLNLLEELLNLEAEYDDF